MKKLIVAIAALAMLTGSAYAAEWNFYGSARVSTWYTNVETYGATGETKNFTTALQSNARIGANVKASDELSGRFEYGTSGGNANIRLLYGVWNFGAGSFLVGQDYTPIRLPYSNSVYANDNAMGGQGELGSDRAGQLKLRFGGFQVAAVGNNTDFVNAGAIGTTTEIKMPQLAAKYQFVGDNFTASVLGGYATFDVNDQAVSSYILGVGAKGTFGAFTAGAQVHGGVNAGNLAGINTSGAAATVNTTAKAQAAISGTTANTVVTDTDSLGWSIMAGYTVNDMFGLEVGYGYQETEPDVSGSTKNEVNTYYIQAPITLAPGVSIVPEIGVVDYKETGETETTYAGAKWQINF